VADYTVLELTTLQTRYQNPEDRSMELHHPEKLKSLVAAVRLEPEGAVHILPLQVLVMYLDPWFK
jgi:hypothetical protein